MENIQLVKTAPFQGIDCDIYEIDGKRVMTREQIGSAIEYANPRQAIANIHERHRERLNKFSVVLKLRTTDGKTYDTTAYDIKGVMEICRWRFCCICR